MAKESENNVIEVSIEISEQALENNQILKNHYDAKKKILSYQVDENIPEEVKEELKQFLSDESIGPKQIACFNPLIVAMNLIQSFKDVSYEPLLSDEKEEELKQKCQLDHISYDLTEQKYIFDFNDKLKSAHGNNPEKMKELTEKVEGLIEKALEKQHDDSYQDYKDAKKQIGSFNSGLTTAKKELKDPYLEITRKIDGIYKAFKLESDNTKEALDSNFKAALDKEQQKKDEAERKKKQAELDKIEELSKQNKEQADKLQNQETETLKAQAINNIRLTNIGTKAGQLLTTVDKLTIEALQEKKIEMANIKFEDVFDVHPNHGLLSEEERQEILDYFNDEQKRWDMIVSREIESRENKEKLRDTTQQLQQAQQQVPSFMNDQSGPFNSGQAQPPQQQVSQDTTEDDKFGILVSHISAFVVQAQQLSENVQGLSFEDDFYKKTQATLSNESIPTIVDWATKMQKWAKDKHENYINWKASNQ